MNGQEDILDLNPGFAEYLKALVRRLDRGEGAPYKDITELAFRERIFEEYIKQGINSLLDTGDLYEPRIGFFKVLEGANA